jgi:hypothetical protein
MQIPTPFPSETYEPTLSTAQKTILLPYKTPESPTAVNVYISLSITIPRKYLVDQVPKIH